MPVIGIDYGTANCYVAKCDKGTVTVLQDEIGNRETPSCFAINDGMLLIGSDALGQLEDYPESLALGVKRVIGRAFEDPVIKMYIEKTSCRVTDVNGRPTISLIDSKRDANEFRPEEIVAVLLKRMKKIAEEDTNEKVTGSVLTVPSSFDESQRRAIMDAASIAGIRVLGLINESTAAAVAYGVKLKPDDGRKLLIFHLGAGTATAAVATIENHIIEVQSCVGSKNLGGNDLDEQVLDHAITWLQKQGHFKLGIDRSQKTKLLVACSKAKKILSHKGSTQARIKFDEIFEDAEPCMSISRREFENMNSPIIDLLIDMVEMALLKANMPKEKIDDVLVVGGAAKILYEMERFSSKLPHFEGRIKVVPENEASVMGAAIMAGILSGDYKGNAVAVHDIVPDEKTILLGGSEEWKNKSLQPERKKQVEFNARLVKLNQALRSRNFHVELVVSGRNSPLRMKPIDFKDSAGKIKKYQDKGQRKIEIEEALNELHRYALGLKKVLQSFIGSSGPCNEILKWINNIQMSPSFEDIGKKLDELLSVVMKNLSAVRSEEFLTTVRLSDHERENQTCTLKQMAGIETSKKRYQNALGELRNCASEWSRILESSANGVKLCVKTAAWVEKAGQVNPTLENIQEKFTELLSDVVTPVAQLARRIEVCQQRNQTEAVKELQDYATEIKNVILKRSRYLEQCNQAQKWLTQRCEKTPDDIWRTLATLRADVGDMSLSMEKVAGREGGAIGERSKEINPNLSTKEVLKVLKDYIIIWRQILVSSKTILNLSDSTLAWTDQWKGENPTLDEIRKKMEALKKRGKSMIGEIEKLEQKLSQELQPKAKNEKNLGVWDAMAGGMYRLFTSSTQQQPAPTFDTQPDNPHNSTLVDERISPARTGGSRKDKGSPERGSQLRTEKKGGAGNPSIGGTRSKPSTEQGAGRDLGRIKK